MAITFTEITLRGVTQEALTIEGDVVILRSGLSSWDLEVFKKIDKTIDGSTITTLKQAFDAYIMGSGATASAYYANFMVNVVEANATFVDNDVSDIAQTVSTLTGKVSTLEASSSDHEGRIAALEVAP